MLSVLQKLERTGWVEHRSHGRSYLWSAARSRESEGKTSLGSYIDRVFRGDPLLLRKMLHSFSCDTMTLSKAAISTAVLVVMFSGVVGAKRINDPDDLIDEAVSELQEAGISLNPGWIVCASSFPLEGDKIAATSHSQMTILVDMDQVRMRLGLSDVDMSMAPPASAIPLIALLLAHEYIHAGSPGLSAFCDHVGVYHQGLLYACEVLEDLALAGYDLSAACTAYEQVRDMLNSWLISFYNDVGGCGGALPPVGECAACA